MNNGNFSKIKWVVLCICLLAGGFFLLKNLNIQSVDQYDRESDRIAGQIQIKEAATGQQCNSCGSGRNDRDASFIFGFAG